MENLETLQKQAREIGEKISDIESTATRKANQAKVGKFFRTRNSYSCPEKPSDYWWLYAEVTRMDEYGMLYVTEFQTDKNGDINIRFDQCHHHMQHWVSSSRAEFHMAWARMLAVVKGITR